jgi:hypothetical protein
MNNQPFNVRNIFPEKELNYEKYMEVKVDHPIIDIRWDWNNFGG